MFYQNRARAKAKKLVRELKGNISLAGLEKYIEDRYKVIFFNSEYGNREIERYNLEAEAGELKAFTYSQNARLIFIDNKRPLQDKMYLLLHEIGHITLEHIGDGKLCLRNPILADFEADAFSYEVLMRCRGCVG